MQGLDTQSAVDEAGPANDASGYQPSFRRYSPPISEAANSIWSEILRLDLAQNVAELEVLGYTVVPPEKVASPSFIAALREAVLCEYERRFGVKRGMERDGLHYKPLGDPLYHIINDDPIFEKAMMNPVGLALTTYMLGRNAIAANCLGNVKTSCESDLDLHADHTSFLFTAPFPVHAHICNVTLALTDYTRENGSICFVPGSHKYYRGPNPGEGNDERVAIEAPAGSLIFFGGNVWHGAFARTAPGFRVNLVMTMARPNVVVQEAFRDSVPDEALDRNPPRFRKLMGRDVYFGWGKEGPRQGITEGTARHVYD